MLLTFQTYISGILARVPSWHWVVIVFISLVLTVLVLYTLHREKVVIVFISLVLTVSFIIRKKLSAYSAIVLGITVFVGLLLLDTALLIRFFYVHPHATGTVFKLDLSRLFHGTYRRQVERLSNLAVFVPFGFFLSEFLSSSRNLVSWRQIGRVTIVAFGLSLSIECLQLILGVGFFEVADLILNTIGGFVGAGMALMGRKVVRPFIK